MSKLIKKYKTLLLLIAVSVVAASWIFNTMTNQALSTFNDQQASTTVVCNLQDPVTCRSNHPSSFSWWNIANFFSFFNFMNFHGNTTNPSPSPSTSPSPSPVSSGPATYTGKFLTFFSPVNTADGVEYWYLAHGFSGCSASEVPWYGYRQGDSGLRKIFGSRADASGITAGVVNIPYQEGTIDATTGTGVGAISFVCGDDSSPFGGFVSPRDYPDIRYPQSPCYNGCGEMLSHAPHHVAYPNGGHDGGQIAVIVNGRRITGDPGNPGLYTGPANTALQATMSLPSGYTACYSLHTGKYPAMGGGSAHVVTNHDPNATWGHPRIPTSGTFTLSNSTSIASIVCAGPSVRPATVSVKVR